jgi:hypothetical protein
MKKQNQFKITIPSPCHENWEEMTAVERGRFCRSCQKVVTDFTQMEDGEIIQFLKEGKGHCGRFRTAQLDRSLIPSIESPRYFVIPFHKEIAASLLIMAAFTEKTFAQQKKPNSSQQHVTPTKKTKAPVIISGHLLDFETQKPLAGMDIYLQIEGFDLQFRTTNRYGGFTFSIPANQQKGTGILNIDTTGTNYTVIDEEISLGKSTTDLHLFCYGSPEILNEITKTSEQKNIFITRTMGVIEAAPRRNIVDIVTGSPKKISLWYRITHRFKRRSKK